MKDKLLSIVVPAYNTAEYIEDCVKSIMMQTYKAIEVIIVNDGSTDDTEAICDKLAIEDARIKYVYQENAGVTAARTKGVELASGDFIAFVDSDDYIMSDMAEKMMRYMPEDDLVIGSFVQENASGAVVDVYNSFDGRFSTVEQMHKIWENVLYSEKGQKLDALGKGTLWGKIFKKDIILQILQRMDSHITFAEDVTIFLQYILQCKSVMFLNEKVYFYRYRVSSAMHSSHKNMLENINRIYNVLRPVFEAHQMSENLLNQLEMWMYFLVATGMNNYMGLSQKRRVLQFFLNMEEFVDKKIAIYGAGQMGQDLVWLYGKLGQKVYAWIDRNYAHFQHEGMDVQSVEVLEAVQETLDVILIAVNNPTVVGAIKKDLISRGIPQEKIVWKEPISIY